MSFYQQPRVLVIGVGQEWRGDDAAGLLVARYLKDKAPSQLIVRELLGSAPDLLNLWQDAAAVIIADAIHAGAEPGTIFRFAAHVEPLPADLFPACSTHAWGIAEAVALGRVLHQLPPYLIVYGIAGKNFALGESVSTQVAQAIPVIAHQILQEVQSYQELKIVSIRKP